MPTQSAADGVGLGRRKEVRGKAAVPPSGRAHAPRASSTYAMSHIVTWTHQRVVPEADPAPLARRPSPDGRRRAIADAKRREGPRAKCEARRRLGPKRGGSGPAAARHAILGIASTTPLQSRSGGLGRAGRPCPLLAARARWPWRPEHTDGRGPLPLATRGVTSPRLVGFVV